MTAITSSSSGIKRAMPSQDTTTLDILLSHVASKKKLPISTERTHTLDYFLHQALPALSHMSPGKEKLNRFLELFDLVRVGHKQVPSGVRAEVWLEHQGKWLFLTVFEDGYYSTAFKSTVCDPGPYLYLSVCEWEDNGGDGELTDDLVLIRMSLENWSGEWMWIRKSPSFSGTESKDIASTLSKALLCRAYLWDTAKVKSSIQEIPLSFWLSVCRPTPETFYSKQGFLPANCIDLQGDSRCLTQSYHCYLWALETIRSWPCKEITPLLQKKDEKQTWNLILDQYKGAGDDLTTLCKKVDKMQYQFFCVWLIEGKLTFAKTLQGRIFDLARKIVAVSQFLVAHYPPVPFAATSENLTAKAITYLQSNSSLASAETFTKQIIAEDEKKELFRPLKA